MKQIQREHLEKEFTAAEVKAALWTIDGDKVPGPDGYGSKFFKDSWNVIGGDVPAGVLEFFKAGQMLRGVNGTMITLILKIAHANSVEDY